MNSKGHFVFTSILALAHLGTSTTILYKANTLENLDGARLRKQAKYQPLIADLESHPSTRKVS